MLPTAPHTLKAHDDSVVLTPKAPPILFTKCDAYIVSGNAMIDPMRSDV